MIEFPTRRNVLFGASLGLVAVALGPGTAQATGASIALSPSSGPAGTVVTVTGTGFPKKGRGTVALGGASAPLTTSASGYFKASLTVPAGLPAGAASVIAQVGSSSAAAPFTVAAGSAVPGPNLAHPLRFGVATLSGFSSSSELDQVASLVGEGPSIVHAYFDWNQPVPSAGLSAVAARGATPLLTWEPWDASVGGTAQPGYALSTIYGGAHDAYISQWANGLKAFGDKVLLRLAHEMNANWYPWCEGVNGNAAGDYAKAYRHVRDIFTGLGVTNVEWVWCPNVPYPGSTALAGLYPGDAYADLVGLDGYNWGTTQSWGSTWTAPDALFGTGLSQLASLAPTKRVLIAEVASAEQGGDKAAWNQSFVQYLTANPSIMGFAWFDLNKETDWRIDSSSTSAAAFASALAARP